jgi:diacylglycerol kinase (ATP)
MRIGVVRNPRSHGNAREGALVHPPGVLWAEPTSLAALDADLARFAAAKIEALIIDGGDGTVRNVLSALPRAFAEPPLLAVLAGGKTNVLALDLAAGHPLLTLEAVLRRLAEPEPQTKTRAALEASWSRGEHTPIRGLRARHAAVKIGAQARRLSLTFCGPDPRGGGNERPVRRRAVGVAARRAPSLAT